MLFAFEEAIGFMPAPVSVLEKDGITAAGMVGEILAYLEDEAAKEAEDEENDAGETGADGEEPEEKLPWTLSGILDRVSKLGG